MNILYFFKSTAEFTVKTSNPLKLIDDLRIKVPVRSITCVDDEVIKFTCFYGDMKKAENIIFGNKANRIAVKCYGFKYLLYKYRKRLGLFSACLSLLLFVMLSGMFVWEIRVEGNEKVDESRIVKVLKEVGFKEGILKKGVDLDSIVNEFLIREKRISWIAVNYDGTVAHVEVREAKLPEIYEKKENVNLIASNDGIVMRSDVIEGGCLVKKGDVVYKGQILVSAFIDRNEKSTLRGARGSVWANTERQVVVKIPLAYKKKIYTGNSKKGWTLNVLGKRLNLGGNRLPYELFSETEKEIRASIDPKYHLPFTATLKKYDEYVNVECERTEREALEIAKETATKQITEKYKSFTVASKNESSVVTDGVLEYKCVFSGVENIAVESEFEIS